MTEGVVDGRFRIDVEVVSGGMGVIYRALDLSTGDTVALKRLWLPSEPARRRFEREALLLQALSHPHIVRYVAHGADRGEPFLVMEWIEGCTLEEYLARATPTLAESIALVGLLAETLGFAHRAGVVHRDVKPANVMLVDGDLAKPRLVDFGLAFEVSEASRVTEPGSVAGTYRYMSPEQARGLLDVDARSDVYSLATMLFELVTGARVFEADGPTELILKLLCAEAPRLAHLVPDSPPSLDHLVMRALSKIPESRPRDGASLAVELRSVAADIEDGVEEGTEYLRLSGKENRIVSILLVGLPPRELDATVPSQHDDRGNEAWTTVDRAARAHGGSAATLRDGRCVVLFSSEGRQREHAIRSARCALRLRQELPGVALALATGRATGGRQPTAESIERLCGLRADALLGVAIDETTEALLPRAFAIGHHEGAAYVRAEPLTTMEVPGIIGHGRSTEQRLLAAHAAACKDDETARVVVIVGAPGMGKSHLLETTSAGLTAWTVWRVRADPMAAATPYALLATLLRRAVSEDRRATPTRLLERLQAATPGIDLCVLGIPLGVPVADLSPDVRVALSDPRMLADQVTTAAERFVARHLANGPLVVAVDDLEWADPPSLRVIQGVLRAHRSRPLLVLATARDDSLPSADESFGLGRAELIRLTRLSERACEEWITLALVDVTPARARELIEWSGGIPMHLFELLRIERERPNEDLAPSMGLLLQASLERYPADVRQLLQVASVFGDRFDRDGPAHVLAVPAESIDGPIRGLIDDGVLERDGTAYRFRSAALRETAYEMLPAADRQRAHRRAGHHLRQIDEKPARIAHHYALADASDRLAELWLAAASEAMGAADADNAAVLVRRALEGELPLESRVRALLLEARALAWQGDLVTSRERATEALEIAPERSDEWWTALSRLTVRDGSRGERERFERIARLAIDNVTETMSPHAYVAAVSVLGTGIDVRSLELAGALDRRLHESRVSEITADVASSELYARSRRALIRGELDVFLSTMKEVGVASEEAGQRVRIEIAMREIGTALIELGRPTEAVPHLLRAMRLSHEMGRPLHEARARALLAHAHIASGDIGGARVVLAPLLDEATPASEQTRARARLSDAEIAIARGDLSRASRQAERARVALPEHAYDDLVAAWELSARAAIAAGDLDSAVRDATRAVELARTHPIPFASPARAFETLATALERVGRTTEAEAIRAEGGR